MKKSRKLQPQWKVNFVQVRDQRQQPALGVASPVNPYPSCSLCTEEKEHSDALRLTEPYANGNRSHAACIKKRNVIKQKIILLNILSIMVKFFKSRWMLVEGQINWFEFFLNNLTSRPVHTLIGVLMKSGGPKAGSRGTVCWKSPIIPTPWGISSDHYKYIHTQRHTEKQILYGL